MTDTIKPIATVVRSWVKKTYRLDLTGCEPRPVSPWHQDRLYRPSSMTVDRTEGNVSAVVLSGAVLKKDGTEGARLNTERLFRRGAWPAWVTSIVDGLA